MNNLPVIVAGAGIAGLTAAIAFARQGFSVALVEKRTGFQEGGAGIQLSPNATRILLDLGVAGLARNAVAPEQLDIRHWGQPRSFAHMPMAALSGTYGAPFWVTRREDLHIALLDTARAMAGITILVDRAVTGFTPEPDAIQVEILRGNGQGESIKARFLVAADGLWSSLRRAAGQNAEPAFTGFEAWRTLVPAADTPGFMRQPRVCLWMGRERHAVHYPVDAGRQVNLVLVRRTGQAHATQEEWSGTPPASATATLSEGAALPLVDLIKAAPSWRRWPLYDSQPCIMGGAGVADGRLALIGDAAHPVLPFLAQGAALGIEDAALLAQMLGPALSDGKALVRHAAITRFNAARLPRAAKVCRAARSNGRSYHLAWPWSLARDAMVRHLGADGMVARHDWIYGWKPGEKSLASGKSSLSAGPETRNAD